MSDGFQAVLGSRGTNLAKDLQETKEELRAAVYMLEALRRENDTLVSWNMTLKRQVRDLLADPVDAPKDKTAFIQALEVELQGVADAWRGNQ